MRDSGRGWRFLFYKYNRHQPASVEEKLRLEVGMMLILSRRHLLGKHFLHDRCGSVASLNARGIGEPSTLS